MSDDCEIPSFYQATEQHARAAYRCCECDAPIEAKEKYLRATGKWEGELRTFRQHLLCARACEWVRDKLNDGECLSFGQLFSYWNDQHDYYLHDQYREHKQDKDVMPLRAMLAQILRRKRRYVRVA